MKIKQRANYMITKTYGSAKQSRLVSGNRNVIKKFDIGHCAKR